MEWWWLQVSAVPLTSGDQILDQNSSWGAGVGRCGQEVPEREELGFGHVELEVFISFTETARPLYYIFFESKKCFILFYSFPVVSHID